MRWLLFHALFAPWGTMVATGVLVNLDKSNPDIWVFWRYWGDIDAMANLASYGAAVYGCAVSGTEVLIRVAFYAIAKILDEQDRKRKERERMLKEAREAGLQEGLGKGVDIALNTPTSEQHPELRERIRKEAEAALKENGR